MGRIIRNTISYGFVTLILAALGFCIYLFLDDLDGPEVTMTPDTGRISPTAGDHSQTCGRQIRGPLRCRHHPPQ